MSNQIFTEGVYQSNEPFHLLDIDGVFGLGFKNLSRIDIDPPFYNMIKHRLVEKPVFSFYFPRYLYIFLRFLKLLNML